MKEKEIKNIVVAEELLIMVAIWSAKKQSLS